MTDFTFLSLVLLPVGLGLLGFIEPCSIGSTLVFVKYLEGKTAAAKIAEVAIFSLTRALLIGLLGMAAVLVGTAFIGVQKIAWIGLGSLYVMLGALYLSGRVGLLKVAFGLARPSGLRGSAGLGLLFGLNVPACAAPLIFALLAAAAAGGASGANLLAGFVSLALFGLALTLPIVAVVLFARARRALDWLAGLSNRLPVWTGVLLIALGLWSIGFGLFASIEG